MRYIFPPREALFSTIQYVTSLTAAGVTPRIGKWQTGNKMENKKIKAKNEDKKITRKMDKEKNSK